jgi:hypothetical protein
MIWVTSRRWPKVCFDTSRRSLQLTEEQTAQILANVVIVRDATKTGPGVRQDGGCPSLGYIDQTYAGLIRSCPSWAEMRLAQENMTHVLKALLEPY